MLEWVLYCDIGINMRSWRINQKGKVIDLIAILLYVKATKSPLCCLGFYFIFFFFQLDTSSSHLEREIFNWRITHIRLSVCNSSGIFSCLIIDGGGPSPLWAVPPGGPGWYKWADWASSENQPEQTSSMVSPLASFKDRLWFVHAKQTNPFTPKLVLLMVFITAIEKQTKRARWAVSFTYLATLDTGSTF